MALTKLPPAVLARLDVSRDAIGVAEDAVLDIDVEAFVAGCASPDIEEQRRILVGGAPHHHAVDVIEFGAHLRECREAAVEHHGDIGKALFQGMDETVIQGRKFAVLPWR